MPSLSWARRMTGSVLRKAISWNGVGRRLAAVLVLAAAVVAVSPVGAAEATTPKPEPGQVPGMVAGGDVFGLECA